MLAWLLAIMFLVQDGRLLLHFSIAHHHFDHDRGTVHHLRHESGKNESPPVEIHQASVLPSSGFMSNLQIPVDPAGLLSEECLFIRILFRRDVTPASSGNDSPVGLTPCFVGGFPKRHFPVPEAKLHFLAPKHSPPSIHHSAIRVSV